MDLSRFASLICSSSLHVTFQHEVRAKKEATIELEFVLCPLSNRLHHMQSEREMALVSYRKQARCDRLSPLRGKHLQGIEVRGR